MKRFLIVLAVFAVACGPQVRDKDKSNDSNSSANGSPNNSSNNVNGSTNGTPNNTSPNNTTPNNTNPNNTNPNNTNPNNTNPNNTNPNNTNPNNTNPNNTNPNNTNPNNTNPNNNMIPPDVVQKCATACELLWGNCIDTRCSLEADIQAIVDDVEAGCKGTGGDAAELCTTRYQNEPGYADLVDQVVAGNSCNTDLMNEHLCFTFGTDVCTGCATPDLGGPCTNDSQCSGGLLAGYCIAQDTDGSYPGGQCLAGGCQFDANTDGEGTFLVGGGTGCGEDGACYVIDATSSVCFPRCLSNNDCDRGVSGPNQSGYSCSIVGVLGTGDALGICQTACSDALPCDTGLVCGNTQACEYECTANADCPADFNCTGVNGNDEMYCEFAG